jgi:Domain of unknown function (DUF4189)
LIVNFDKPCIGVIGMLIVQALWANHAGAAGALAVGVAPGGAQNGFAFGIDSNRGNAAKARAKALARCRETKESNPAARSRCMVVGTFRRECVVVAIDPKNGTPGVGWAIAADRAVASRRAVAGCEATAGSGRAKTCKVSAAHCDKSEE